MPVCARHPPETGQVWGRTLRYVRTGNLIGSDHLPTLCQEAWTHQPD